MATQSLCPVILGFWPISAFNGSGTLALNAANTWVAFSFVASQGLTLSKARVEVSAAAGSGTLTVTADLFSDASGVPGVSLEGPKSVSITVAGYAAAYQEWSGFSTLLTAGTRYWIVLKNTTDTPGTNYPTIRWWTFTAPREGTGSLNTWGWGKVSTLDGAAWTSLPVNAITGLRLEFNDLGVLNYLGMPLIAQASTSGADQGSYWNASPSRSREFGVKFTTPANLQLNLKGLAFWTNKGGTTQGALAYKLYEGDATTPTATTLTCPTVNVATGALPLLFANAQTLKANTTYRVTISAVSGGDATNQYRVYYSRCDADANSRALYPLSMAGCYLNGTWDDVTYIDYMVAFALITDTASMHTAPTIPAATDVRKGTARGYSGDAVGSLVGCVDADGVNHGPSGILYGSAIYALRGVLGVGDAYESEGIVDINGVNQGRDGILDTDQEYHANGVLNSNAEYAALSLYVIKTDVVAAANVKADEGRWAGATGEDVGTYVQPPRVKGLR